MLAGAVVVVGVLLIVSIRAAHRDAAAQAEEAVRAEQVVAEEAVGATGPSQELACRQLVELVADYLDGLLPEKMMADVEDHLAGCDGARSTVRTLSRIGWSGGEYRSEAVLADVELASPVSPHTVHVVIAAPGLVFLFPLGEHATWRLLATRRAAPSELIHGAFGPPVPAAELQELLNATGWAV